MIRERHRRRRACGTVSTIFALIVAVACASVAPGAVGNARNLASEYQKGYRLSQLTLREGANGLPRQIEWEQGPPHGVLIAPCHLFLKSSQGTVPIPPMLESELGQCLEHWGAQHLVLAVQYGDKPGANISFTIQNLTLRTWLVQLELVLRLISQADRAFFPAASDPRVELQSGRPEVVYSYGTRQGYDYGSGGGIDMALPLASVYTAKRDWGLALLGDEHAPIAGIIFKLTRSEGQTTVRVFFPDIRLSPNGKAARRLYLAPTAGDWRPSLAAALALFPQVFEPRNPDIAELGGPFVTSSGTPLNDVIADWRDQGTRAVEIHGIAPFYGRYVPRPQPYVPFCDDVWHYLKQNLPSYELLPESQNASWREIRNFVETYVRPTMTRATVRDYIARLHRYGMKGFLYLNPTEAWAPWAAAEFPGDRRIGARGKPVRTWLESVEMIPDENRLWGKYILGQLRGELALYPHADGILFDQSAEGGNDLYELCATGCRMVRTQGKVCWWNGPYNAELASLADGMMTEGGWRKDYRKLTNIIQYYGLAGKPIVSLGPATPVAYSQLLLHGVTPKAVPPDERKFAEKWFRLFSWLRGRRWVLQAHALEIPPDVAANIFQVPGGNYVVPLVMSNTRASATGASPGGDVRVRVDDGGKLKSVFLLSPEHPGYEKLQFQRTLGTITNRVPSLNLAGLLLLTKSEMPVNSYFHLFEGD